MTEHYIAEAGLTQEVQQAALQVAYGSRLHVSMVRVPVSVPGGHVEVYAIYRDITERKRADEGSCHRRRGPRQCGKLPRSQCYRA